MGCTSAKQASQPGQFQPNYGTATNHNVASGQLGYSEPQANAGYVQPQSNMGYVQPGQPNTVMYSGPMVAGPTMKITIKTLSGISKDVDCPDSVTSLKEMAAEISKCTPDQVRLLFAGKQLEDGQALSSQNITSGSTVHCVLRLRQ